MRCLPTALAVRDRAQRIRESQEISAVTHDDARCTVSCAAYNEIVAALLEGVSPAAVGGADQVQRPEELSGCLGVPPRRRPGR